MLSLLADETVILKAYFSLSYSQWTAAHVQNGRGAAESSNQS